MLYQINEDLSEKINNFLNKAISVNVNEGDIKGLSSELSVIRNTLNFEDLVDNASTVQSYEISEWSCLFQAGELAVMYNPDFLGPDHIFIYTKDGKRYHFNTEQDGYKISNIVDYCNSIKLCYIEGVKEKILEFTGGSVKSMVKNIVDNKIDFKCTRCMLNRCRDVMSITECKFCIDKGLL